jgi:hypothetical protein
MKTAMTEFGWRNVLNSIPGRFSAGNVGTPHCERRTYVGAMKTAVDELLKTRLSEQQCCIVAGLAYAAFQLGRFTA